MITAKKDTNYDLIKKKVKKLLVINKLHINFFEKFI